MVISIYSGYMQPGNKNFNNDDIKCLNNLMSVSIYKEGNVNSIFWGLVSVCGDSMVNRSVIERISQWY